MGAKFSISDDLFKVATDRPAFVIIFLSASAIPFLRHFKMLTHPAQLAHLAVATIHFVLAAELPKAGHLSMAQAIGIGASFCMILLTQYLFFFETNLAAVWTDTTFAWMWLGEVTNFLVVAYVVVRNYDSHKQHLADEIAARLLNTKYGLTMDEGQRVLTCNRNIFPTELFDDHLKATQSGAVVAHRPRSPTRALSKASATLTWPQRRAASLALVAELTKK